MNARKLILLLVCGCAAAWAAGLDELKAAIARRDAAAVERMTAQFATSDSSEKELLTAGGLLGEGDYLSQAAGVFQHCLQRYPASFEARYNFALAEFALGEHGKAEAALEPAQAESPERQAALAYLRGKIYNATGRLKQAQESLRAAYQAEPYQENYALDWALLQMRLAAYVPAVQMLESTASEHPDSPEVRLELALAYALAGRTEDALTECGKLDNRASSTPALIRTYTRCARGDYGGCSAEAVSGLRSTHPHPYLHYLHAMAEWSQPAPNAAGVLSEVSTAISALPHCRVCLQLRSRVYESLRNYDAAVEDIKTVLAQDATAASAWYRLAELYKKLGSRDKANEAMHRFQALHKEEQSQEAESFREQVMGERQR